MFCLRAAVLFEVVFATVCCVRCSVRFTCLVWCCARGHRFWLMFCLQPPVWFDVLLATERLARCCNPNPVWVPPSPLIHGCPDGLVGRCGALLFWILRQPSWNQLLGQLLNITAARLAVRVAIQHLAYRWLLGNCPYVDIRAVCACACGRSHQLICAEVFHYFYDWVILCQSTLPSLSRSLASLPANYPDFVHGLCVPSAEVFTESRSTQAELRYTPRAQVHTQS